MGGAKTTGETTTTDHDTLKMTTQSTLADTQVKVVADDEVKGGAKTTGEIAEDYFCSASENNVNNKSTPETVVV